MNKYIFLDIDGVLNSEHTFGNKISESISDQYIKNLQKIVKKTDAKIILSSSWRIYFSENVNDPRHIMGIYLVTILAKYNLNLHDMTPFVKGQFSNERGLEIKTYIDQHKITNYIVIDDEEFSDFKTHLNMSRFIQTTFGDENTSIEEEGLYKEVAEKAIEILNGEEKWLLSKKWIIWLKN